MSKLNIQVNDNFRLTSDDAQFIVLERRLIDPTRAPGYKAPDDGSVPELRETYDNPRYYTYSSVGLVTALNYVRIKSAGLSNATTLTELMTVLREESERIVNAINAAGLPEISVKLGA